MGKFIQDKAIVNRNIDNYINYTNSVGRFFESAPTITTYFQKNLNSSTEDVGLGNVVEIIGPESPILYNRIEGVPIWNVEGLQLAYEYDEDTGIDTPVECSGNMIPTVLKPSIDEFFIISYMEKDMLFRITNIEGGSLGKRTFYKINFTLSRYDVNYLEENQIDKRLEVDPIELSNSKSSNSPIIQSDLYSRKKLLDDLRYNIKNKYIENYYDKEVNKFLGYNSNGERLIYCNHLHKFCNDHYELFHFEKTYLENLYIEPINTSNDEINSYSNSIYNFIDEVLNDDNEYITSDLDLYINNYLIYNTYIVAPLVIDKLNDYGNSLSLSYKNYNNCMICGSNDDNALFMDFYNLVLSRESNSDNILASMLVYVLDNEITLETKCDNIIKLLKINKNIIFNNSNIYSYLTIPCILYILYWLSRKILEFNDSIIYNRKETF